MALVTMDTCDIFWMLLSIFYLSEDRQLEIIDIKHHTKQGEITNLYLFKCSLETYASSWIDEFDFLYDSNIDEPTDYYLNFIEILGHIQVNDCLRASQYINGQKWKLTKKLGMNILKTSGLPPLTLKNPIDFTQLIRVFFNQEGVIQQD